MRMRDHRFTRGVLAGSLGLSLATAAGLAAVVAQEATPTPTAPPRAPAAPVVALSPEERTAWTEALGRLGELIATVQADRDAVASQTDVTVVDALLAQATTLRNDAETALASDDPSTVPGMAMAAAQTARAAQELLRAGLSDYGLPSQQAQASRVLSTSYYRIKETADAATASGRAGDFYLTTAQDLYGRAYDLYAAGTYAQAARTAEVAAELANLGALAAGDPQLGGGFGRVHGEEGPVAIPGADIDIEVPRGVHGRFPDERMPFPHAEIAVPDFGPREDSTPVAVPEPNFDTE